MKKSIFFYLSGLVPLLFYSQSNISVYYNYYYKQHFAPVADEHPSILTISDSESLYVIDVLKNQSDKPEVYDTDLGRMKVLKEKSNRYFYKDLKKNIVLSSEAIYFNKFTVSSNLNSFNWGLTNNQKVILGYNCQEALLNYGGRKYIAYFTNELPISNGPYKFHGLPGLILEIYTKDEKIEFKIEATNINLKSNNKIMNPYLDGKKIYTRSEFEALYKKKYDEVTSFRGEDNSSLSMSKGKIELIIRD